MTNKEMKSISFDGGSTIYNIVDSTARNELNNKLDIAQPIITLNTSGTVALSDNTIYKVTPSATITFTLPTITNLTTFHQILVQIKLSTVYTLNLGTSYYFNATAPDMSKIGMYNLFYEYDNENEHWIVGAIIKGSES